MAALSVQSSGFALTNFNPPFACVAHPFAQFTIATHAAAESDSLCADFPRGSQSFLHQHIDHRVLERSAKIIHDAVILSVSEGPRDVSLCVS